MVLCLCQKKKKKEKSLCLRYLFKNSWIKRKKRTLDLKMRQILTELNTVPVEIRPPVQGAEDTTREVRLPVGTHGVWRQRAGTLKRVPTSYNPPMFLCTDQRGTKQKNLNTFKLRKWCYDKNKTNSNDHSKSPMKLIHVQRNCTYFMC